MTTPPTRIVVVAGSSSALGGATTLASENSRLQTLLDLADPDVRLDVLTNGASGLLPWVETRIDLSDRPRSPLDRVLTGLGAALLFRRLSRFPLGRLLNSMGPMDPGRVMWRAVRRDSAARATIRDADVLIAADAAGVKTGWIAMRRGWVDDAFYDHSAASAQRRR